MNRETRLFIWALIKLFPAICYTYRKYDLFMGGKVFDLLDWIFIVIVLYQLIVCLTDIENITKINRKDEISNE